MEEETTYNLPGSIPAFLPVDNLRPEWFTETLVDNIRLNRYKYCILGPKPIYLYIFSAPGCYHALIRICDFFIF